MRAPILCLFLALACFSQTAFSAETNDTIAAMKNNCLTTGIPTGGATTLQCQVCVNTIGNLDGLTSQRMYACYDVCQSSSLAASSTPVSDCISCISNPAYDVNACKQCLNVPNGGSAACIANLANDPYKNDNLDASHIYKRLNYFYAVAQCASLPDTTGVKARTHCFTCISTKLATPQGAPTYGIQSYAELNPATGPVPVRDNDFGACVFLANQTDLISKGSQAVQGTAASCVPKGYKDGDVLSLPLSDCMQCVSDVEAVLVPATSAPRFPPMSYACADYCQNPDYYPAGSTADAKASLAKACVSCLKTPSVTSAWACGNCMKTTVSGECFTCITADPYKGKASNFNWACGMCANIGNANLRSLCMQCIKNQPGAGDGNTNHFTEANICSCIDLIQNNSISVSGPLTAMERSCYVPLANRSSTGALLPAAAIPWGNLTVAPGDTSDCVKCMRAAPSTAAYACHEYCQDPALVSGFTQGSACSSCVTNANVADPSACKTCMVATSDNAIRGTCFSCIAATGLKTAHKANHAWGCGQCAQLPASVQASCFKCLSDDVYDPCVCIDGIKNGTLTGH